ncbi:MAG: CBS domain-containing protein [Nevskia sp.]|nr:CBS domain-containing protein [Nevskia sp.]
MRVGEVCNRAVVVAAPETGVVEAAQLMREYHVGTLVVVERDGAQARPLGIVTDRDLVIEVLAKEAAPEDLAMEDFITGELITATQDDDLLETLGRMRSEGIRRMPVIGDQGELVGILSVDDVLEMLAEAIGQVPQLVRRQQTAEITRRP